MDTNTYESHLEYHYSKFWGPQVSHSIWSRGPGLAQTCNIYEYPPTQETNYWVYATSGMTPFREPILIELFLVSPQQTEIHIELLTVIADYHQSEAYIGLGDTVNFGRPWMPWSKCEFGLISLPYTYGPLLEQVHILKWEVQVLWLIPITREERDFKATSGLEALEERFEKKQFNYMDPLRASVAP